MSDPQLEEMGPIDYIVMEWDGEAPVTGEVMPQLLDLVDRGLIRILDIGLVIKDADGSVTVGDLVELAEADAGLAELQGASSGLLGNDDLE